MRERAMKICEETTYQGKEIALKRPRGGSLVWPIQGPAERPVCLKQSECDRECEEIGAKGEGRGRSYESRLGLWLLL